MAKTAKKGIGIKYEDKSAGQPDLGPIFARIKELLDGFQKESLRLRGGEGGQVADRRCTELAAAPYNGGLHHSGRIEAGATGTESGGV